MSQHLLLALAWFKSHRGCMWSHIKDLVIDATVMYFSIIDFLLWLFTMSCIIHISMAVCSTMIQSIIVLSTCQLATSSGLKLSDGCNHRPDRSF